MEKTRHLQIGQLGERLAGKYLQKKGFSIVETNFRRKFGEIDIIARKGQKFYFVEVKTVRSLGNSTKGHYFNPLENVHKAKQARLGRAIQTYLMKKSPLPSNWQFDVITVRLDTTGKRAVIQHFENLIIES